MQAYLGEKFGLDPALAQTIAFLAEGNLSKAEALMNGSVDQFKDHFEEWFALLKEGHGGKLVDWVESFNGKTLKTGFNKEDKKNFLLYALKIFKKMYFEELDGKTGRLDISVSNFENLVEELEKALYHLERNSNPKILFLDVSLRLSHRILNRDNRKKIANI
jgi:DNA polymerase-3 subunit delta'